MGGLAVVTGASGGIGREIAKLLARDGYDLVLAARSAETLAGFSRELTEGYGIRVIPFTADLTHDEERRRLFEETPGDIDILINNAGFGDYGRFSECEWEKQERMIELNDLALTHITHLYLPGMISKGKGRILNVASIAAFEPGPLMSVYYASKAYVLSFSEALSVELKDSGITVTALCPGPVNTGFAKAANAERVKVFRESAGADASKVAEFGYRKMMKGRAVAVHGLTFKAASVVIKILPRPVVRKLVYLIQRSRTR